MMPSITTNQEPESHHVEFTQRTHSFSNFAGPAIRRILLY